MGGLRAAQTLCAPALGRSWLRDCSNPQPCELALVVILRPGARAPVSGKSEVRRASRVVWNPCPRRHDASRSGKHRGSVSLPDIVTGAVPTGGLEKSISHGDHARLKSPI